MSMMTTCRERFKIYTLADHFNFEPMVRWIPAFAGKTMGGIGYCNFEFVWILVFGIWSLFYCHMNCRRAEHQAVDGYSLEPGFDQ